MQKNTHQQVKDAINVLGVTLKVSNLLREGIFIYLSLIIYKMQLTLETFNKLMPI